MAETPRRRIIDEVVTDLESLPDEQLAEVRDFVELIRQRASRPRRGSPEALLQFFGTWEGPPGELDRLVGEIYDARHEEED